VSPRVCQLWHFRLSHELTAAPLPLLHPTQLETVHEQLLLATKHMRFPNVIFHLNVFDNYHGGQAALSSPPALLPPTASQSLLLIACQWLTPASARVGSIRASAPHSQPAGRLSLHPAPAACDACPPQLRRHVRGHARGTVHHPHLRPD
jgi:hypothetical protein